MVGDPGIEPGVSRLEGVTVPCHTLRPVAQPSADYLWAYGPSTAKSLFWAVPFTGHDLSGIALSETQRRECYAEAKMGHLKRTSQADGGPRNHLAFWYPRRARCA